MSHVTINVEIIKDAEDLWSSVFGSAWETCPWWVGVKYLEGGWNVPGRVRITPEDPDTGERGEPVIVDLPALAEAVGWYIASGYESMCALEDLDAVYGDVIIQKAVFGEVVYG